ncbi:hypothetical protein BDY19DRAFT_929531 [Irpex rosettiformis]|uniref:Uncharacterized protein n=1 Tax=Irpex rosettiformis TaxID=378272 RepID=A0ACB8UDL7_9APHY|nr:hypothetical protein BDY19DRAFT_929531 [Irpex rosettiformis]
MEESSKVAIFRSWLANKGGFLNPNVVFQQVPSGFNVVAKNSIEEDAAIVSCPFSLAITPGLARKALNAILGQAEGLQKWNERQLVCTYVSLHWILANDPSLPPELEHGPYIDMLPNPLQLRTSVYFTTDELEAFRGTNIYGATIDRINTWRSEWEQCVKDLQTHHFSIASQYSPDHYQRAATYLSSRAFPSTLLSKQPTLISQPDSYPVLLPGVDTLNHARAQPVSWVVSHPNSTTHPPSSSKDSEPSISLVLHNETPAGAELFNNYGLKPNSELILGYGFTLPNNPDDTIVLKIGGADVKWEVGRNALGIEPVWEAVKAAVAVQTGPETSDKGATDEDVSPYEMELWATETLTEMVEGLLSRLPVIPKTSEKLRPEVRTMLEHYVEGQQSILQSIVQFAQDKESSIIEYAQSQGVKLV